MPEMLEEQGTSVAPACWNLPEKASYWSCYGNMTKKPEIKQKWWHKEHPPAPEVRTWSVCYYTKEEAEADAVSPRNTGWVWDGQPAHECTIGDCMFSARRIGRLGVIIKSYQNGNWVTVKRYPSGVPLPLEEV